MAQLTNNDRDYFEHRYSVLFDLWEREWSARSDAVKSGNFARAHRIDRRISTIKAQIRELDDILRFVFHTETNWEPDEFFPEFDRCIFTEIKEG